MGHFFFYKGISEIFKNEAYLLDSKLFSSRKYVSHIYIVAPLRAESETTLSIHYLVCNEHFLPKSESCRVVTSYACIFFDKGQSLASLRLSVSFCICNNTPLECQRNLLFYRPLRAQCPRQSRRPHTTSTGCKGSLLTVPHSLL